LLTCHLLCGSGERLDLLRFESTPTGTTLARGPSTIPTLASGGNSPPEMRICHPPEPSRRDRCGTGDRRNAARLQNRRRWRATVVIVQDRGASAGGRVRRRRCRLPGSKNAGRLPAHGVQLVAFAHVLGQVGLGGAPGVEGTKRLRLPVPSPEMRRILGVPQVSRRDLPSLPSLVHVVWHEDASRR